MFFFLTVLNNSTFRFRFDSESHASGLAISVVTIKLVYDGGTNCNSPRNMPLDSVYLTVHALVD